MLDAEGPGCIIRIWMGASRPDLGPQGTLRFYLDGSEIPAIEAKADDLLSGRALLGPSLAAVSTHASARRGAPRGHGPACKPRVLGRGRRWGWGGLEPGQCLSGRGHSGIHREGGAVRRQGARRVSRDQQGLAQGVVSVRGGRVRLDGKTQEVSV